MTHPRFSVAASLASALLALACGNSESSDTSGQGVAGSIAPAPGSGTSAAGTVAPRAAGSGTTTAIAGTPALTGSASAGRAAIGGAGTSAPSKPEDDTDAGVPSQNGTAGAPSTAPGPKADDGILAKPAFKPAGMPIMAPDNTWTYVSFPDTKCRSGSPAGISVNLNNASKRVMIYLEGGGACFDSQTCGANPDAVGNHNPANGGVFDRTRAENPVKDWNFVYVPYCTGDVHMGAKDDGQVEGVSGTQHFVGRLNLKAFMDRVVPTFAGAEQVLLTGVSAGGFGAASNAAFVQWTFGDIPVTMVDDSGPTFSSKFLPKCLTDKYVKYWGLENSILDDCGKACSASEDYSVQFLDYTASHAAGHSSGLIESDQDSVIRGFYGIGTNNGADDCQGILLLTSMSTQDFLSGLLDLRDHVKKYPGFSTYYPSSTQHTWLGGEGFYTGMAGDVKLIDWFKGVIEGKPAVHAGH